MNVYDYNLIRVLMVTIVAVLGLQRIACEQRSLKQQEVEDRLYSQTIGKMTSNPSGQYY
jgi:hypothetical protein